MYAFLFVLCQCNLVDVFTWLFLFFFCIKKSGVRLDNTFRFSTLSCLCLSVSSHWLYAHLSETPIPTDWGGPTGPSLWQTIIKQKKIFSMLTEQSPCISTEGSSFSVRISSSNNNDETQSWPLYKANQWISDAAWLCIKEYLSRLKSGGENTKCPYLIPPPHTLLEDI